MPTEALCACDSSAEFDSRRAINQTEANWKLGSFAQANCRDGLPAIDQITRRCIQLLDSPNSICRYLEFHLHALNNHNRIALGNVRAYMKRMSDIVASYRERLGDVRTGSAVDVIVRELPGLPLIDTTIGMELTGKGFTAVSDALKVLERDGVITYVGSARRSRLYAALDIIQAEQAILDAYLPRHDADGSIANL